MKNLQFQLSGSIKGMKFSMHVFSLLRKELKCTQRIDKRIDFITVIGDTI